MDTPQVQHVSIEGPKAIGLAIKQAAISQGVNIQVDFVLSEEIGDRRTKIVGDGDEVAVHPNSRFICAAHLRHPHETEYRRCATPPTHSCAGRNNSRRLHVEDLAMGINHIIDSLGPSNQMEKADPRQVLNDAGGYSFKLTDWDYFDRFLILGTEGGTFYAGERKLSKEAANCVRRCVAADGRRTVARIAEVSSSGRAPKNDQAELALAIAASEGDPATQAAAFAALPKVCRIGTHLYHFVAFANEMRGWGPAMRKAVARWFNEKTAEQLAYQLAKYQSRDGWSARDLLRLSHAKAPTPEHQALYRWATAGYDALAEDKLIVPPMIEAFEEAKKEGTTIKRLCQLIRDYRLPRECVPTQHLTNPEVWDALLPHMGLTAMIRNLGNMTKCGLVQPLSDAALCIARTVVDEEQLKKSRVHPMAILIAMKTYASGRGLRGDGSWSPVQSVVDGLDQAFYASFGNVESCGKRIVLGIDCSGSMTGSVVAGTCITAKVAAAAMALVTANAEPTAHILGYHQRVFDLPISSNMRLDDVVRVMQSPSLNTDCALPILWATQRLGSRVAVDGFVNYTDNETFHGMIHPHEALRVYRQRSGIPARAACVAMTVNEFSILDPTDAGSLNVAGFDAATPQMVSDFIGGK